MWTLLGGSIPSLNTPYFSSRHLSRHTAFFHSVSCTPLVRDVRWSETLLKASKDPIAAVNHRSRFGGTALHSCIMSFRRPGEDELRLAAAEWLLDRGANADSKSSFRH